MDSRYYVPVLFKLELSLIFFIRPIKRERNYKAIHQRWHLSVRWPWQAWYGDLTLVAGRTVACNRGQSFGKDLGCVRWPLSHGVTQCSATGSVPFSSIYTVSHHSACLQDVIMMTSEYVPTPDLFQFPCQGLGKICWFKRSSDCLFTGLFGDQRSLVTLSKAKNRSHGFISFRSSRLG